MSHAAVPDCATRARSGRSRAPRVRPRKARKAFSLRHGGPDVAGDGDEADSRKSSCLINNFWTSVCTEVSTNCLQLAKDVSCHAQPHILETDYASSFASRASAERSSLVRVSSDRLNYSRPLCGLRWRALTNESENRCALYQSGPWRAAARRRGAVRTVERSRDMFVPLRVRRGRKVDAQRRDERASVVGALRSSDDVRRVVEGFRSSSLRRPRPPGPARLLVRVFTSFSKRPRRYTGFRASGVSIRLSIVYSLFISCHLNSYIPWVSRRSTATVRGSSRPMFVRSMMQSGTCM
ncbi:hypothetical protein EVAR_92741_1 [Eumeta japonica]|uniref:Uncharacterized protein n=1 Tax=Eumeta variegata TaxID=151549 RepID=A0A4C1T000_EUMVA|nr:hypothetical protein EVAR_92741_1 [Eumeta japonica]